MITCVACVVCIEQIFDGPSAKQLDREILSTDGANSLGPELPSRGHQSPPPVNLVFYRTHNYNYIDSYKIRLKKNVSEPNNSCKPYIFVTRTPLDRNAGGLI